MKALSRNPLVWGVVLTAASLLLGYAGYRASPGPQLSHTDALFRAIQLFALDADFAPGQTPWQLNVARFSAPLIVFSATAIALTVFLRDQLQRLFVTAFAKDHVVVVGLGQVSAAIVASLRTVGHRVVVVESDARNARLPGVRAIGARVVIGDATQPVILERARLTYASDAIVTTGDDARNLEIADQITQLPAADGPARAIAVHVAIEEHLLWTELGSLQLSARTSGVVVEHFNLVDRAAQALLARAMIETVNDVLHNVLIEGDGPLAERLLVHLVRLSTLAEHRCVVHIGPSARTLFRFIDRQSWLRDVADFVEDDDGDGSTEPYALVCLTASDSVSLARSIELAGSPGRQTVIVSLTGAVSEAALRSRSTAARVVPVRTHPDTVARDLVNQSGIELMAQARHDTYVDSERERGMTSADNASLAPWAELPDSLRQSNRRFAQAVGDIVDGLGGRLVPLRKLPEDAMTWVGADLLERLAVDEHDRWMSALTSDGWTYATGPKDPTRKTHPLLVPWSDLDEHEREKDRDSIRVIPSMLARVGYAISFEPSQEDGHVPQAGNSIG